jgi:hypothetical protein
MGRVSEKADENKAKQRAENEEMRCNTRTLSGVIK